MKKMTALLLALLLVLCFAACGGEAAPAPSPTPTPVPEWVSLTTEFEAWVYDFIEACDYYIANPTDQQAYQNMMTMNEEAADWDLKVSDMQLQIGEDTEQMNAFTDEINRIVKIMTDYSESLVEDSAG